MIDTPEIPSAPIAPPPPVPRAITPTAPGARPAELGIATVPVTTEAATPHSEPVKQPVLNITGNTTENMSINGQPVKTMEDLSKALPEKPTIEAPAEPTLVADGVHTEQSTEEPPVQSVEKPIEPEGPPQTLAEANNRNTPIREALSEARQKEAQAFEALQQAPTDPNLRTAYFAAQREAQLLDSLRTRELLHLYSQIPPTSSREQVLPSTPEEAQQLVDQLPDTLNSAGKIARALRIDPADFLDFILNFAREQRQQLSATSDLPKTPEEVGSYRQNQEAAQQETPEAMRLRELMTNLMMLLLTFILSKAAEKLGLQQPASIQQQATQAGTTEPLATPTLATEPAPTSPPTPAPAAEN